MITFRLEDDVFVLLLRVELQGLGNLERFRCIIIHGFRSLALLAARLCSTRSFLGSLWLGGRGVAFRLTLDLVKMLTENGRAMLVRTSSKYCNGEKSL